MVATLSLSLTTFAWISTQKSIDGVTVVSGSLSLNNLSTGVYRYEYPYFDVEEIVHNYEGVGKVSLSAITTSNKAFTLNIFDPTYLTIKGATTQEGISSLLTTLVVQVSFSVTYSTPVDYEFLAYRKTVVTSSPLASSYLHYMVIPKETIDNMTYDTANNVGNSDTSDAGVAQALLFSKIKYYSQLSANSSSIYSFPNLTDASVSIGSGHLITTRPSSVSSSGSSAFYIAMDYDQTLVSGKNGTSGYTNFYDEVLLGNSYDLVSDFYFGVKAIEAGS